jgi:hypothetical protein
MEQLTGLVAEAIVYMRSPQAAEDMAAYEAEQAGIQIFERVLWVARP